MGLIDSARVDVAAVLDAAHRYDSAAGLLDSALQRCLSALTFSGARAGREYADGGDEVRRAVEQAVNAVRAWSRSGHEIASELRTSAADYVRVDDHAARRIG
ncbi:MAG: type VII secretion target [Mycobacterium sp.]